MAPGMCIAANDSGESTSTSVTRPPRSEPISSSRETVGTVVAGDAELTCRLSSIIARAMDCTARVREFPSLCRRDGSRLTLALAAPASAQYFGRNKVLYKPFDFKAFKTEHFDISPDLVRGYDVGTFQAADCLPAAASGCPALDQL